MHDASSPLYAQIDEAEEKIDEQVEKHAYDL
jgi:ribosome-associated translation inhibitor RaiA